MLAAVSYTHLLSAVFVCPSDAMHNSDLVSVFNIARCSFAYEQRKQNGQEVIVWFSLSASITHNINIGNVLV